MWNFAPISCPTGCSRARSSKRPSTATRARPIRQKRSDWRFSTSDRPDDSPRNAGASTSREGKLALPPLPGQHPEARSLGRGTRTPRTSRLASSSGGAGDYQPIADSTAFRHAAAVAPFSGATWTEAFFSWLRIAWGSALREAGVVLILTILQWPPDRRSNWLWVPPNLP